MRVRILWGLLCCFSAWPAGAAETGKLLTETELKREPFIDATTLKKLQPDSEVGVLKRQGGWMQVQPAEGEAGWVKLVSLKLGDGSGAKGDSGLGALWNAARSGRSGSTGVTVASGVRGLDAEALSNAKPDPAAVEKLKGFAASNATAETFAGQAKLKPQTIDYLAENASAATSAKGDKK